MANHRAGKRTASRGDSADPSDPAPLRATPPRATTAGKRKAVKPSRSTRIAAHTAVRKNLFPAFPSTPSLVGTAALVIAAGGAVTIDQNAVPADASTGAIQRLSAQANVLSGSSQIESSNASNSREQAVSRDSQRDALHLAAEEELQAAAEAQEQERNAALAQLEASAEKRAEELAANAWGLPLSDYRLTGTFGETSSLWANTHTGLDFAAPAGTPIMSIGNGVVTDVGYSGAFGNRTIVTLEDGTEIWYGHQASFAVSPGENVRSGQKVGFVGSTGNVTGPHLHLEVRPGAGDPVDPYAALVARGLRP